MPPELVDTTLAVLRLAFVFGAGLFLPLILQLLLLFLTGWALKGLAYRSSWVIASFLGLIGVPIHEFSHAAGSLITLAGVAAIKPLIDELGYAFVAAKRPNLVDRVVSSIAPLFGGLLVLWLTATYIIPGFETPTVAQPSVNPQALTSMASVVKESLNQMWGFVKSVFSNLPDLEWRSWRTWAGLYIALSVGIHIAPSSQDLKIFFRALPIVFLITLPLFAWLYFSGSAEQTFLFLQEKVTPAMIRFSTAMTYALILTSFGLGGFLLLYLWQKIRGR
jgi:hypothetical protein